MTATTRALPIAVLAALVLVSSPLTQAQPAKQIPRVGWLSNGTGLGAYDRAFVEGLRELGWVEGTNVVIERRFAEGKSERLPTLAEDLVRLKVDIIAAPDPPAALAAKNATRAIPVVVRSSDDPVGDGLVASLARPGGNVTGVASLALELSGKRLELLREVLPGLTRVAVLFNPGALSARWLRDTDAAARALGVGLQPVEVRGRDELEGAFRAAVSGRAGAVMTLRNPALVTPRVVELAAKYRLPAIYDDRFYVERGGLMSYGTNLAELHRRLATYVDRILKGAKPAELPIEQATRFELVVNLKTAKSLGLAVPQSFLLRADQVIQ